VVPNKSKNPGLRVWGMTQPELLLLLLLSIAFNVAIDVVTVAVDATAVAAAVCSVAIALPVRVGIIEQYQEWSCCAGGATAECETLQKNSLQFTKMQR